MRILAGGVCDIDDKKAFLFVRPYEGFTQPACRDGDGHPEHCVAVNGDPSSSSVCGSKAFLNVFDIAYIRKILVLVYL